MSFEKQEHKSDEIMALNSRGQLPTMKIGNKVLNESIGVCIYLEDTYKSNGNLLIPSDLNKKAKILQRMFEALNLQKFCNENIIYYYWFTPADKLDNELIKERKKLLNIEMQRWETYLKEDGTEFIADESFSMADAIFFPQLAFAIRCGYPISKYNYLNVYYEKLKTRESIKKSWPPHWLTTSNDTKLADC